jgi:hypothetical protein
MWSLIDISSSCTNDEAFLHIEEKDTDLLRKYGINMGIHCHAFERGKRENAVPKAQWL